MSRLAVLHPTTLLGRELREALEARPDLWSDLRLLTTEEEEIGTLTGVAGEAALVGRGGRSEMSGVDLLLCCGEMDASRPLLEALPAGATAVLLCPDASLADGRPWVAGLDGEPPEPGGVLLSPNPAAILLAHLLHPLRPLAPRRAVATVIQPTSVFGNPGLDALLEQTRHVLAMAGRCSGGLFGGQLAFNVLPPRVSAETVTGQLAAVLEGGPPVAVEVLQGGVFHGMSASLWVELGEGPEDAEAVAAALLASRWIEEAGDPEQLGPIDAAGAEGVILGTVRADPLHRGGYWVRAVMDNLTRGGALNAVETAAAVLTGR